MRVHLNGKDSWEDYLAGMRTKARTKVKRIQTLSKDLEFRALTKEEMTEMQDELHALYMSVYGRAGFRLGCLQKEDFALLKEEMGEGFQLWVATLEDELVGFHCGMCDGQDVEAYFVGFDGSLNKSHALYQRMLLEFIQWGLREGCGVVNLGRTALDIKASLGAEPQRLVLHERMKNPIVHRLARWAARASAPKQPPLKRAWKEVQAGVEEVKSQGDGTVGSCSLSGLGHACSSTLTAIFAAMREVAHIPHPLMRITVHSYNGQFRLRYELDRYEQSFKYPEAEHTLADVEARAKALSEGVLMRFVDMREQWLQQESST